MLWIVLAVILVGLAVWAFFAPRLVGLIVLSFVCVSLAGSALPLILPGSIVLSIIWVGVTLPIAWMMLMFWSYADHQRWRPLAGMVAICLACAVVLLILEPGV